MPVTVYLDQTDELSAKVYMDNLREQLVRLDDVEIVRNIADAEVIHLNSMNVLGRIRYGKSDRTQHFKNWLYSILSKKQVVITDHASPKFRKKAKNKNSYSTRLVRYLGKKSGSIADNIIAISYAAKRNLIELGIDSSCIEVVHHGVGSEYTNNASTETEEPYVLHVSRYHPRKNPQAMIRLSDRIGCEMIVAGPGWDEHASSELREKNNVSVPGFVDFDELISLYNRALALYFPSKYEGFGLPAVESMSCGTPVIGSNRGALPEIIGDGGETFPVDDISSHAEAINRIQDRSGYRGDLEQRAESRSEDFSWEKTAYNTLSVYQKNL